MSKTRKTTITITLESDPDDMFGESHHDMLIDDFNGYGRDYRTKGGGGAVTMRVKVAEDA